MPFPALDTWQTRRRKRERRILICRERRSDGPAREQLLDAVFGDDRFAKSSERLREGRLPASNLAFVAAEGERLVGTVRLWTVTAGPNHPCLLLGPLAVAADMQDRGIGAALMRRALRDAEKLGHPAVLLVGDAGYYSRFGFSAEITGALRMPGPYAPERLLACEFIPGVLKAASGLISVRRPPRSQLAEIIERMARNTGAIPQPA